MRIITGANPYSWASGSAASNEEKHPITGGRTRKTKSPNESESKKKAFWLCA